MTVHDLLCEKWNAGIESVLLFLIQKRDDHRFANTPSGVNVTVWRCNVIQC